MAFFSKPLLAQTPSAQDDLASYQNSRFKNPEWDEFVKAGFEAYQVGEFDAALAQLNKAFNKGCSSPLVLFKLALLHEYKRTYYSSFKFYKLAIEQFKVAHQDHPYALSVIENYGRALYDAGKTDEALPLLQKASKKTQSFWLLKLLGMIAFDQNDTLNAISYFERAVRIQSPEVTEFELVFIYTLLGRIFANQGQKEGALRYYEKVLEFDPQNKEATKAVKYLKGPNENNQLKEILQQIQEG